MGEGHQDGEKNEETPGSCNSLGPMIFKSQAENKRMLSAVI